MLLGTKFGTSMTRETMLQDMPTFKEAFWAAYGDNGRARIRQQIRLGRIKELFEATCATEPEEKIVQAFKSTLECIECELTELRSESKHALRNFHHRGIDEISPDCNLHNPPKKHDPCLPRNFHHLPMAHASLELE